MELDLLLTTSFPLSLPTSDHTHRDLPCVKNINMSEDPWTLHPILSPGDAIKDALWYSINACVTSRLVGL